jgi:hypothetical protein
MGDPCLGLLLHTHTSPTPPLQKLRLIPSNVDEFMALMSAMAETQERYESLMERREFVQVRARPTLSPPFIPLPVWCLGIHHGPVPSSCTPPSLRGTHA